eukprot:ctg_411.g202
MGGVSLQRRRQPFTRMGHRTVALVLDVGIAARAAVHPDVRAAAADRPAGLDGGAAARPPLFGVCGVHVGVATQGAAVRLLRAAGGECSGGGGVGRGVPLRLVAGVGREDRPRRQRAHRTRCPPVLRGGARDRPQTVDAPLRCCVLCAVGAGGGGIAYGVFGGVLPQLPGR